MMIYLKNAGVDLSVLKGGIVIKDVHAVRCQTDAVLVVVWVSGAGFQLVESVQRVPNRHEAVKGRTPVLGIWIVALTQLLDTILAPR